MLIPFPKQYKSAMWHPMLESLPNFEFGVIVDFALQQRHVEANLKLAAFISLFYLNKP